MLNSLASSIDAPLEGLVSIESPVVIQWLAWIFHT